MSSRAGMLRSVNASPTSGADFGVRRETPCSTWLRNPRLKSWVESVALEQAARRERVSADNPPAGALAIALMPRVLHGQGTRPTPVTGKSMDHRSIRATMIHAPENPGRIPCTAAARAVPLASVQVAGRRDLRQARAGEIPRRRARARAGR